MEKISQFLKLACDGFCTPQGDVSAFKVYSGQHLQLPVRTMEAAQEISAILCGSLPHPAVRLYDRFVIAERPLYRRVHWLRRLFDWDPGRITIATYFRRQGVSLVRAAAFFARYDSPWKNHARFSLRTLPGGMRVCVSMEAAFAASNCVIYHSLQLDPLTVELVREFIAAEHAGSTVLELAWQSGTTNPFVTKRSSPAS